MIAVALQSQGGGEVVCVDSMRLIAGATSSTGGDEWLWTGWAHAEHTKDTKNLLLSCDFILVRMYTCSLLVVASVALGMYICGVIMLRRSKTRATRGYGAAVTFDDSGMGVGVGGDGLELR